MSEQDVEAAARALDPVAFWPRRQHGGENGVGEDYWAHVRSRRKSARRTAQIVLDKLVERSWAAIEELHEPADAMIAAALDAMAAPCDADDFRRGWRAAIESLLSRPG